MSTTRTASPDAPLKQERWASSPLFDRALKANLVALRCSVLESAELRELVWFIQYLSTQPGALRTAAQAVGVRDSVLAELALNPESQIEHHAPALRRYLAEHTQAQAAGVAITAIGRAVYDALDYCRESRSLVVVNGLPRLGKSFAAERYCEQHPGQARYVQVPSTADDLAFFTAIARALGITIESNAKTKNLRPRIEAALQGGDLALILDEGHYLWPGHNYRLARPPRVGWLMTALVNQRVPVCMIVTPQFFKTQRSYEIKSGWTSEQFVGRIERYVQLPDTISLPDLQSVARSLYPTGSAKAIETLADYANLSAKHVAAIEHAIKQATFLARRDGRQTPAWLDVQQALREGVIPSDVGLAAALKRSDVCAGLAAALPGGKPRLAATPRRWRGGLASVTREAADDQFAYGMGTG